MTGFTCPDCGELSLVPVDEREHELECENCGNATTKSTYIQQTARKLRRDGHDELADRLESAADRFREVEQ